MNTVTVLTAPPKHWDWQKWRKPFLRLTCLLIGSMMFYRALLNLFGYPSEWVSVFPGVPILGDICRAPVYWERWVLGPIFVGGVFGIVLMWRELRIGWWIFTALNFLVGYWFIFILEDIWQHHVLPHIVFSAAFLPFYPGMKRSKWLARKVSGLIGLVSRPILRLLEFPLAGAVVQAIPFLHIWINKIVINSIVAQARFRPHPFSTRSSYTSWASLTDKSWAGRHLGVPKSPPPQLPEWEKLKPIFERPDGKQVLCPKSTILFPAFAQYLTGGFLRTLPEENPDDPCDINEERRKKNNSNHEIDMCTLYGLNEDQTRALRVKNPTADKRGFLRSEIINGEEYPPLLYKDGQRNSEFDALDTPLGHSDIVAALNDPDPETAKLARDRLDSFFAVGGDRVNSAPQVAMINTLWLREHNRLAREIGKNNRDWDDDQVFEIARNIVIVQFIKVVVEDYINHIAPFAFDLLADPSAAWEAAWNKPNWITTEFTLLYRWHSLIPDHIIWGRNDIPVTKTYFRNNMPLMEVGLKRAFEDMSAQPAARIGPRNTNDHLLDTEEASIRQGRICQLDSYNAYRDYLGRKPAKDFGDISSNKDVVQTLEAAYGTGNVDRVDFYVGIFSQDQQENSPMSEIILVFVALDAFSQALPNPLLSEHVFKPPEDPNKDHPAFTNFGWEQIVTCKSLRDIVTRNVEQPETLGFVGMTQANWRAT